MTELSSTPIVGLAIVALLMLVELRVSQRNEVELGQRGAIAPPDPAYAAMRWAYPLVFVAMAVEGMLTGGPSGVAFGAGVGIFAVSKLLKAWAIASLGYRWTYRVFVLPGEPLVTRGPYRVVRHPNYVAVVGELVGFALIAGARVAGPVGLFVFGVLLVRRIRAEERSLGRR